MLAIVRRGLFKSLKIKHGYLITRKYFSTNQTVVVVGGVAGGATASTRMRRNCDKCEIIMFERGKFVSFANCGLPYYVGNVIKDEKKLIVTGPDLFKKRFNIDVRIESNVAAIDRQKKEITVESKEGTYIQKYDKLILAVGASPIRPSIKGIDEQGVFSVRTIEDSRFVRQYLDKLPENRKKAVIVGGGFIGLEMAENLVHRGCECTIIDALPQVMGPIDHEMVTPFHRVLTKNGVDLVLNERLKAIHNKSKHGEKWWCGTPKMEVETESGHISPADLVILGLGVLPENKLAKDCGLSLGVRGSVAVDHMMKTIDDDIYCVGDAVETYSAITGLPINLALAGPAQQQARIVADNITGVNNKYEFRGVQGSSTCMIFDETLASTGLSEKMIEDKENVCCLYAHPGHHADFYPNAKPLHLKLVFDKRDGRILGAQCCGTEGVVKVIDTIAAFIQMKGNVEDIAHAELCYSPQHGSARGPVNIVGQMGMNVCDGLLELADWERIVNGKNEKIYVLDVRSADECDKDPMKEEGMEVINIPMDELRERVSELNEYKNVTINTICAVGKRGYVAARFLKQNGFDVKLCSGGIATFHMLKHDFKYHK